MAQAVEQQRDEKDPVAVQLILTYARLPLTKKRRVITLFGLLDKSDDPDEQREIALAIAEILTPKLIGINDSLGTVGDLEAGIKPDIKEAAQAYRKRIGQAIRQWRETRGLTQEQLAEKSGLLQSHISRLEIGMHAPTKNTIDRLALALGVAPAELDVLDDD